MAGTYVHQLSLQRPKFISVWNDHAGLLMIFNSLAGWILSHFDTVLHIMDLVVFTFEHSITVTVLLVLVVVGYIIGVWMFFEPLSDLNIQAGFWVKRWKKSPDKYICFIGSRILILLLAFSTSHQPWLQTDFIWILIFKFDHQILRLKGFLNLQSLLPLMKTSHLLSDSKFLREMRWPIAVSLHSSWLSLLKATSFWFWLKSK